MTQDLGIDGYGDADLIAEHAGTAVYRCHATRFDRDVVVKIVAGNGFDPHTFEQEARTLRTFSDSPNIARVLDAGLNDRGERYTAMEYASRGSIADQMSAGVTLPVGAAMTIAIKTARALASVHEAGLVHGNVTPSNVLVDGRGEPLLSDIGGVITGGARAPSVAHAAPEVLAGHRPNAAADIYALGSTIYTMLAGHEPFADLIASPEELAEWKRGHDPQPLHELGVPGRASDIVARCMARRPTDRYASARIVAEALALATQPAKGNGAGAVAAPRVGVRTVEAPLDMPATAETVAVGAGALPPPPSGTSMFAPVSDAPAAPAVIPLPSVPDEPVPGPSRYEAGDGRRRRGRRIAAVVTVVALLAAGGAAVAVVHARDKAESPPPTTAAPVSVHVADTALRQAFPTVELGHTPALVSQVWSTSPDRRELTATLSVSNASLSSLRATLRVVIPKQVARSVDDVSFTPAYSVVITKDPKVAYRMVIPAGGRYAVHYVVRFTHPLTAATLHTLAKQELQDLAADAKQIGSPPPKQVPVALLVDPKQATLVMTNTNRKPTVALRATESFDGIVLHDPVLWRSTKPAVADVDATGLVTGYSKGTTVVAATVGSVTVHVPVNVLDNTTTTTASRSTTPRTQATQPPVTSPPTTTTHPPTTTPPPPTTTTPPPTTTTLPPTTTTTTIPVTVPPVPANPDVNGDGVVGCIDVGLVADYVGTTSAAEDINGDGVVTQADVDADLAAYTPGGDGSSRPDLGCPPP